MIYKTLGTIQEILKSSFSRTYSKVYLNKNKISILLDVNEREYDMIKGSVESLLASNNITEDVEFSRLVYSEYRKDR